MKGKKKRLQITVVGDSDADELKYKTAVEVGEIIASMGAIVLTGGKGGVMEAASKGAKQAGGNTVAIIPGQEHDEANLFSDIVIPTGLGHSRNSITALAADILVAIGGGAGTLSEIAFAWIYNKPIIALSNCGGWSAKLAGQRLDNRRSDKIQDAEDTKSFKEILTKIIEHLK